MDADGAPSSPPASVSAPFYGYSKLGYTDQRKVDADVEVTEDRTGDLSLRFFVRTLGLFSEFSRVITE